MKHVRFFDGKITQTGIVEDDVIKIDGGVNYYLGEVKILPPCVPTKIVACGLNYRDHALELGMEIPEEPILFLKPTTSVIGHEDVIICPTMSKRVDYEAELAIVVKERMKNTPPAQVWERILGFTCFNDITARDLQKKDGQWTRAKSFDTFSPIGPFVVDNINPHNLNIELILNDEVKQSSNTGNLIFKIDQLISFISFVMTLLPGDVIATGTPFGVGPIKSGDVIEVRIEKIGTLRNYVR
ncbi:MAG: fumarylacetoacetate hydrolase family protein [Nitrospirota bacterium]